MDERVVVLVDMDCFFCQVEEGLNPSLKGKPMAVVQFGGGLIAVNYEARALGISRRTRVSEARSICPNLALAEVPGLRGKANTSRYRDAGKRVADVLLTFSSHLERASVDEAYLDITKEVTERIDLMKSTKITPANLANTHALGFDNIHNFLEHVYDRDSLDNYSNVNLKLAVGGSIAENIRAKVYSVTGYKCSAGIAQNKILAKLVCGMHKPDQQTILLPSSIPSLYEKLPLTKIQGFGGKFGVTVMDKLQVKFMGDLLQFSEADLRKHFDSKTSSWLHQLAKGIDNNPVTVRLRSKSIAVSKKYVGINTLDKVKKSLQDLVDELHERLSSDRDEYNRRSRHLVIGANYCVGGVKRGEELTVSRSYPMVADWDNQDDKIERTMKLSFDALRKCNVLPSEESHAPFLIRLLTLSATKFEENKANIATFLQKVRENAHGRTVKDCENDINIHEDSSEFNVEMKNDNLESTLAKESFFLRYFENVEKHKVLDNHSIPEKNDLDIGSNEEETIDNIENDNRDMYRDDSTTTAAVISKVQCSECNRMIMQSEYQSHMDYHFAVQIVRNESHLYKSTPSPVEATVTETKQQNASKKSAKRKSAELTAASGCQKLDAFLCKPPTPLADGEGERCDTCFRIIAGSDMATHLDFHAAKKLHLEINSVPETESPRASGLRTNKKSKKFDSSKLKINTGQTKNINSYFKPI